MQSDDSRFSRLRDSIAAAPAKPGVYRWRDRNGDVLYVGKAKNIRNRLRSYLPRKGGGFQDIGPWKQSMMGRVHDFDTTVTSSELEAFVLETNLIKALKPKYNVLMKDDKNYVYVRITVRDVFPEVSVVRRMEDDGAVYFGPFVSAFDTRRLLDALHVAFPHKASKQVLVTLNRRAERGEDLDASVFDVPPLAVQIGRECGIGAGSYTHAQYRQAIDQLVRFFRGDRGPATEVLRGAMAQAAKDRQFERAALLRDALRIIQDLEERQSVSDTSGSDADIIGTALMGDRAHIIVLHERGGKLIGEQSVPIRGAADSEAEILAQFLPQYYAATPDIPATVVIGIGIAEQSLLVAWLTERRGKRVELLVPQRGKRAQQLHMAHANARAKLQQQLARWEAAAQNIEAALQELASALGLPAEPARIEGYDISHFGGTETVGSMVVLRKGKPMNDHYRSFTIRTLKEGQVDDYAALREVLRRRLLHLKHDLKQEVAVWKERGVIFGKARKADMASIQEIIAAHPDLLQMPDSLDAKEFFVARRDAKPIAFARLVDADGAPLNQSVWVDDALPVRQLRQLLVRLLVRREKGKRVFTVVPLILQDEYAEIGFRHVHTSPKGIQAELAAQARRKVASLAMVYVPSDNKPDVSLSSSPDLLVIDGGKGQLGTATDVLKELQFTIPVIGLAKREEEVFVPGSGVPVVFAKDSQAKFLLMRLRDEAHRFANRHREKRGARHAVHSVLDTVPGIGAATKERLLEQFQTISAIRNTPDAALLTVLTQRQLAALRERL